MAGNLRPPARPRKLPLRARMLVLLIGVTTVFLLVMGVVSTVILSRSLHAQRDSSLLVAARNASIQSGVSGGYVAVDVTFVPLQVRAVSGRSAATTALVDAVQQMGRPALLGRALHPLAAFTVPAAAGLPELRAVTRLVPAAESAAGQRSLLVLAQPASAVSGQVRRFVLALLITGGALIGLLAAGGRWLIVRGLAPLQAMARRANDITTRGDLTARMPDAGDGTEVGALGSAIDSMLDQIQYAFGARQQSEQRVREFAADASHELRTPLTTIRGYAELYRQGALGPDQLPNAMRRIEQEARRMSTLVAELLELARLDRMSSLDLAETDLSGLVRDAAADAMAAEPGRVVHTGAPEQLVAAVDERRIRQVLANLLGNVRAHTPVTTQASVRLAEVSGGVLVEVTDAGPGMSAQDAALAFERFHRSGDRAAGLDADPAGLTPAGSGLGLSIVQAIARAHGGHATLESSPDRGTRVRIWLPAGAG
ncbi:MAG TPA: HAMP domain-containing sensor histidine kinase [Streptosporangiaceae bacterium]